MISVIIPTWNQEPARLAAAVASVRANACPHELIIVDDGSDVPIDGALRIPHSGISAALNAGIRAARGDWICWLSSDDTMDDDKLERQLHGMQSVSAAASFHSYRICRDGVVSGQSWAKQWTSKDEQRAALLGTCAINGSTTMIHRDVFDHVGLFDESIAYGQDWDMWCRIGQQFRWNAIKRIMGTRNEWGGNLTAQIAGSGKETERRDAEDEQIRKKYSDLGSWRV